MNTWKNYMVLGDVHMDWGRLNTLLNRHRVDVLFVCGDFGFWPKYKKGLEPIRPKKTKIYFCDGNHEDFGVLFADGKRYQIQEVARNVFYVPRGTTLEFEDLGKVLFFGGAASIDKQYRVPGYDWFPEEEITQEDIYRWLDNGDHYPDIILSHDSPAEFKVQGYHNTEADKASRLALQTVFDYVNKDKLKLWFFGHWHKYMTGTFGLRGRWYGMDMLGGIGRSWHYLHRVGDQYEVN